MRVVRNVIHPAEDAASPAGDLLASPNFGICDTTHPSAKQLTICLNHRSSESLSMTFYSRVLYTTTFEELNILGFFPAYYVFNGLLILLQILHYFWFYLICQVAISAFRAGEV